MHNENKNKKNIITLKNNPKNDNTNEINENEVKFLGKNNLENETVKLSYHIPKKKPEDNVSESNAIIEQIDTEHLIKWKNNNDYSKWEKTNLFSNYKTDTKKIESSLLEKIKKWIQTNIFFLLIIIITTVFWIYFLYRLNPHYISLKYFQANFFSVQDKKNNYLNLVNTWTITNSWTILKSNSWTEIEISTPTKEKEDSKEIINSWSIENSYSWTIETTNIWWYEFKIKKITIHWVDFYVYDNLIYSNFIDLNTKLKEEILILKQKK